MPDPGNYTVQGKKVMLTKANHPPDDEGMNGEGEFSGADNVAGTFLDYQNHSGTWAIKRRGKRMKPKKHPPYNQDAR